MGGVYRRPRKEQRELPGPPPRTATSERLAREFQDRPLGGSYGELIVSSGPQPPPLQGAEPVRIPPPPWSEHYDPALDPPEEQPTQRKQGRPLRRSGFVP
jgi:hypothetical protein